MSRHHIKKLILLRHSKADPPHGVADHERPLSERGHVDAPEAGRWLVECGAIPDFILCSSALRTRQTCTWVCEQLGDKAPTAKLEDRLYNASATQILSVINHVPETVTSLLVISHMPAVQSLAIMLAGEDSDDAALEELSLSFPSTGVAVLEHEATWAELDLRGARVTDFAVPRAPVSPGQG